MSAIGILPKSDLLQGANLRISGPQDGTEIGGPIAAVLTAGADDILLVTDGKSRAIDIKALAKSGARISVVLIGDDSLEAKRVVRTNFGVSVPPIATALAARLGLSDETGVGIAAGL